MPLVFAFKQLWFSFQLFFLHITLSNPNGVQFSISIHYIHTIVVVRVKIHHYDFFKNVIFSVFKNISWICWILVLTWLNSLKKKKRCQDSQGCLDGVTIFIAVSCCAHVWFFHAERKFSLDPLKKKLFEVLPKFHL